MTQIDATIGGLSVVCLVMATSAVARSAKRWLAIGYALGGVVLVLLLGFFATLILAPHSSDPEVVNPVLDMIGHAVGFAAPICAVIGANIPPDRKAKKV